MSSKITHGFQVCMFGFHPCDDQCKVLGPLSHLFQHTLERLDLVVQGVLRVLSQGKKPRSILMNTGVESTPPLSALPLAISLGMSSGVPKYLKTWEMSSSVFGGSRGER